jgi:hypothetical protein
MTGKRNMNYADMTPSRRLVVDLRMTDVQYEALFASPLQRSETATSAAATAAICSTLKLLGPDGCTCRVAQEFGDHPEEARDRMRWARDLVAAT